MAQKERPPAPAVISASRRTDIPAFYMDWFMDRIDRGYFEVVNPYNRRVTVVPATPDHVHSIVFWSKDFGHFLSGGYGKRLERRGYHLFFNFTLNAASRRLEPRVPPLERRLVQLEALSKQFGPASIHWRFDPVCFYRIGDGPVRDSTRGFTEITEVAARCGVKRCITSFMDLYPKVRKRAERFSAFSFVDPPIDRKIAVLSRMVRALSETGIRLHTCCEKSVLEGMDPEAGVSAGACIPGELLLALFGGRLSLRRDTGQRRSQGCGCRISTDIGVYHLHPCFHNCLFCYANPAVGGPQAAPSRGREREGRIHADRSDSN
jgi:hypothetical protein